MATKIFRGDAVAVKQVDTVTITAYDAATTYTVTINGKAVSVVGTGGTTATTATALQTALDASTIPEFTEVDWTVNSNVVTGTAGTAGKPFTKSVSVTGGTGTISGATTTNSAGPSHWDTASNWSPSGVPSTDDVYIENTDVDILYGIDQNAVTLTSLNIAANYTGKIGLPDYNETGDYYEYREKFLKISATTVNIGYGDGSGSGRIKLNVGSNAATFNITSTGTPAESGVHALILIGTHASNVLNVLQGDIGVALAPGETSVLVTIRIGFEDNPASDVTLDMGSGVTLTTINQSGGDLTVRSAVTTLNMTDGTYTHLAGNITTANLDGGTVYYQGVGTIGTLNLGTDATADFSRDLRGRTVTNCTMQANSTLIDSFKTVTFSNAFLLDRCSLAEVTLDLGNNFSLQRS